MKNTNILTTVTQIKERNVYLVKSALRMKPSGTKQSIAQATGLSITTCNSVLNELYESGEVLLVTDDFVKSIGRPAKSYRFNKDYKYVCCLNASWDYESSTPFFHYAIIDLIGGIVEEDNVICPNMTYFEIEKILKKLIARYPKISTICFGTAGYYDNNVWLSSCIFSSFNGRDIVNDLGTSLNRKIIVENDMNAIAYGIYHSDFCDNYDTSSLVVISFFDKSGPGAGIIYNGQIVHGYQNFAGEVGYLPFPGGDIDKLVEEGPEAVAKCATHIIECVTSVLNPATCILMGERLNSTIVDSVLSLCRNKIPKRILPRLVYMDHYSEFFIKGLYHIALDSILDPSE